MSHLAKLLSNSNTEDQLPNHLRVLDLCSGSGCISLLLCHEFYSAPANHRTALEILGVDLSPTAVRLSLENKEMLAKSSGLEKGSLISQSLREINFIRANVLDSEIFEEAVTVATLQQAIQQLSSGGCDTDWDVVICNPPYISSKDYMRTTYSSVRRFEPRIALVPPSAHAKDSQHDGDLFYPHILLQANRLNAKIVLLEVADLDQAKRVAALTLPQGTWSGIEIWRDEPGRLAEVSESVIINDKEVPIFGSGNGRSVLLYRRDGERWLGKARESRRADEPWARHKEHTVPLAINDLAMR